MALELKHERQGVTKLGRFDFFAVQHTEKLADGSYVFAFTSVPDQSHVPNRELVSGSLQLC